MTTANQLNLDSLDRKPCATGGLSRSSRGWISEAARQSQRMRRVCRTEACKILSRAAIWSILPCPFPAEAVPRPGCPDIQASVQWQVAGWPLLSDPARKIQKDLDIAEYTDPGHNPMIPHTIVLEPGLVIYKIYNGYWFFGRPTLEELRHDLRAVTKKCRPDWDITTPELKAAWQQGRKELFYPYGKTYAQTLGEQD